MLSENKVITLESTAIKSNLCLVHHAVKKPAKTFLILDPVSKSVSKPLNMNVII
jgi:hypothetical protein